jgi:activator of 2-hydroxyglutaryl-CoA dehydratase
MKMALEKKIGMNIDVPEHAQICGAIGAAILGAGR